MTYELKDAKAFIASLLSEPDSTDIEIEMVSTEGDITIVDFTIEQAPRDMSGFWGDFEFIDDLNVDQFLDGTSDDSGKGSYLIREAIKIQKTDVFTNLEMDSEYITLILTGNLSLGDYCDDETDGYLSGTIAIESGDGENIRRKSNEHCSKETISAAKDLGRTMNELINAAKLFGADSSQVRPVIQEIARSAFAT